MPGTAAAFGGDTFHRALDLHRICTVNTGRNSDMGAKHLDEIGTRLHKKARLYLKASGLYCAWATL